MQPRRTVLWNPRAYRRGTLLVVVLGLLVALFVIGTSFSFVTLSERRAAANYLDRQRALDLALDGIEYSVARLRAEAVVEHYEGIKPTHAGYKSKDYDARLYSLRPLDAANPSVSWSRAASSTSHSGGADGNWADFDGNGEKGGNETSFGTDKIPSQVALGSEGWASSVTGFHADGISINQVRNKDVARASEEANYGPSGTYEQFGDYFRVRTVDAASLLNLNNFKGDRLSQVLLVLGDAIDAWLNGTPTGKDNPFYPEIVQDIVRLSEDNGWVIESKEELRPIYASYTDGERLFDLANNFITVASWQDPSYRDYCDNNTKVEELNNPRKLTEQERWRSGWADSASAGMDGWPDWQPAASGFMKSPININTASKPVLVAMLAGIEAKARLLFYQKQDLITANDQLYFDNFTQAVPQQTTGTTDLGRQNNSADIAGTGVQFEVNWYPSGANSRGIFQMVPIGPIETMYGKKGATSSTATGSAENAGALAEQIILMRSAEPFRSWQDFDARFLREVLLRVYTEGRTGIQVPDLVGVNRGDLQGKDSNTVKGMYPESLLPRPDNCNHAANPIKSGDAAMKGGDFRAWYWKSCVDMLRAALCPSNISNRYNADYPYHLNVDRMDLTVTSAPVCFSSMGVYEVVSMGELLAPAPGAQQATSSGAVDRLPVARRKVRSVVKIYDVWRHSSQADFMTAPDPAIFNKPFQTASTTAPPIVPYARLTKSNTNSGPFSIDEMSAQIWNNNSATESALLNKADDSKGIGYKRDQNNVIQDGRDRWKGHNEYTSASRDFGYVTMNSQDRTPFTYTDGRTYPLAFHARFNESLRARTELINDVDSTFTIEGVCSDQAGRDQAWGHLPLETGALFDDFISSASPRDTGQALVNPAGVAEFATSSEGEEATKYSSLVPDGVRMSGQSLRFRARSALAATYGTRGLTRYARLKILRYPCGSHYANYPFMPIQPTDNSYPQGVKDSDLPNPAWDGSVSEPMTRMRLEGLAPPWRGLDDHNRAVESIRQRRSNMPYYEGTVDFWIKWDLPAQGSERNNIVAAMGEIDPASHNFSGLFGATMYGRFRDTEQGGIGGTPLNPADVTTPFYSEPFASSSTSTERDDTADFEGVQFFVYKEPGGWLRFTRMYFSEAFGANVVTGATGSSTQNVTRFGNALRRIVGPVGTADGGPFPASVPFSPYSFTNDIVNDVSNGDNDKGFLYSRTDSWVDLSNATYVNASAAKLVLRPHDWHRFTLSYNSNTTQPYRLWLDGRQVSGLVFNDDPSGDMGFRNDGRHKGPTGAYDQQIPATSASGEQYLVYRTTVKLLEINPEDRLTVGCIFRRQPDIKSTSWYSQYFADGPDPGNVTKSPRPVFKFDSNFVAVANATIDDFRISKEVIPLSVQQVPAAMAEANSRYFGRSDPELSNCFFEQGFFPMADGGEHVLGSPVRVGTISWTELRPDFDPYRARGIDLPKSSRVRLEWAVFEDYQTVESGGADNDLKAQKQNGDSGDMNDAAITAEAYWARGGMSLRGAVVPSGTQVGMLMYRVHFQPGDDLTANNTTAYLLDVTVTVLTPPRKLWFLIEY